MRWLPMLLLLLVPVIASAGASLPLRQGDPVTILRRDGTRADARFVATAENPPRLLLARTDAQTWSGWSDEVPLDSIARVDAPGATEFREVRVLRGIFVGMIVGGVLAFALHKSSNPGALVTNSGEFPFTYAYDDRVTDTVHGMQFGSVMGAIGGFLTAGAHGPSRSWTFDEVGRPIPVTR